MITQLNIHPYPKKLWLIYGEPDSSVIHKFASEADNYQDCYSLPEDDLGRTIRTKKGNVVIRFQSIPTDPAAIAHEAFHAAFNILDYIGMSLTDESEEAFAYLLDSVVSQIHNEINK